MPVLADSFYAFAASVVVVVVAVAVPVVYTRSHNMFMCEGVKSLKQQQHHPYLNNNTQLLPNNIVYLDAHRFFLCLANPIFFYSLLLYTVGDIL